MCDCHFVPSAHEPAHSPTSTPPAGDQSVRTQLLAAALETATIHGIAKLSMADVARRAGLSRQTLYRYFPNKTELLSEVVANETTALIMRVVGASQPFDDPRDALEVAMLTALTIVRDHPLLDRLVRTEPEALLPLLTSDGGPVMTQVRAVVEVLIQQRQPELDQIALRRLADIVTRLLVSYAVSAPDDPPEVVAQFVAAFLTAGSLDAPSPSTRSLPIDRGAPR